MTDSSTIGQLFEIAADPSKAIAGIESFRDRATAALAKTGEAYQHHMQLSDQLQKQTLHDFAAMSNASRDWQGMVVGLLGQVTETMLQQMETDKQVSITHALTQAAMAESTILGVKATAVIKAAYEAAEAIAAAARMDWKAAGLHTLASVEYAALAAAASSGSSSGLSKSSVQGFAAASGPGTAGAAAGGTPLAAGAQPPNPSSTPSGAVTVMVAGPSQAAQWMAGVLNKAVQTQSLRLVSSHTMRPAPAVRSG